MKILTGDLRIGLREGWSRKRSRALSRRRLDDVKEANMLLGDIGQTASLAAQRELDARS